MASRPLGSRFPTHEVATEMIRVSDNSATNLMNCPGGGNGCDQRPLSRSWTCPPPW